MTDEYYIYNKMIAINISYKMHGSSLHALLVRRRSVTRDLLHSAELAKSCHKAAATRQGAKSHKSKIKTQLNTRGAQIH